MAEMIYFENENNSEDQQQKNMLKRAGFQLKCKSILEQQWTREKLLPFVRGKEPSKMLNIKAPEIKSGSIDPVLMTFGEALDLMVASPALIKGPLYQMDGLYIQGCNDSRVMRVLKTSRN